ncbi:unnamed protein product [Cylicostephanus goldi]|uniref:BTB domain-containing protein n=1 Tax=Cylicostephanus goldi TaxID=71465 RepID=A0A3P6SMI0_CYLGO|nr:unnamed protein product [Cylicostephanus goldi]
MISLGPHFSKKGEIVKGGIGNNSPPNQLPPQVHNITLHLKAKDDIEIPLVERGDRFVAESLLSLNLLNEVMEQMTTLTMRVSITIFRSYFDLDKLIDLSLKQPKTTPAAEKILSIILTGEKPRGFDWVITVAEGSPREYFVHKKVLADASPILQVLVHTHSSLPNENLLMVSHEDRFILTSTHADDMKTILTYLYLRQYAMPPFDAFARVGRALCALFPKDVIEKFFEHWQVAIVRDILKLDVSFLEATVYVNHVLPFPIDMPSLAPRSRA